MLVRWCGQRHKVFPDLLELSREKEISLDIEDSYSPTLKRTVRVPPFRLISKIGNTLPVRVTVAYALIKERAFTVWSFYDVLCNGWEISFPWKTVWSSRAPHEMALLFGLLHVAYHYY